MRWRLKGYVMGLISRSAKYASMLLCFGAFAMTSGSAQQANRESTLASPPRGLILQANEGERRVRRPREAGVPGLPDPFILKVDRRNGGSPDLVMGYEELAPGHAIRAHHHLLADEIIFVHSGRAMVSLGDRQSEIGAGGTVYIPRNTRIAVRNIGSEPLAIAFIFSRPGFEELMRANSVLEGETATPITAAEEAAIMARNRWHTIHD
jgi:quercetin dioxygenase-like cupin family protein